MRHHWSNHNSLSTVSLDPCFHYFHLCSLVSLCSLFSLLSLHSLIQFTNFTRSPSFTGFTVSPHLPVSQLQTSEGPCSIECGQISEVLARATCQPYTIAVLRSQGTEIWIRWWEGKRIWRWVRGMNKRDESGEWIKICENRIESNWVNKWKWPQPAPIRSPHQILVFILW